MAGTDSDDERETFDYDLEEVEGSESEDDAESAAESPPWRFSLEDVSEEGVVRSRIEAGDPNPEHVLFVVLGAVAMVLVFVRLFLLVG